MKASNLRIGNYVNFGIVNEPIKVLSINPSSTTIEMAQPIPLTEEWLLKFGFSRDPKIGGDRIEFRVYRFDVLTFNTNHGWWHNLQHLNATPLDYVHQLQNLFFALTGEELTLEP